jgi:hypothetical protein
MNDPSGLNDPRGAPITDSFVFGLVGTGGISPTQLDDGAIDAQTALPADHPAWQRDVVAISARARAVLTTLRPVVVRIVTFWDHVVRGVGVSGKRTLEVDPSGCYRLR